MSYSPNPTELDSKYLRECLDVLSADRRSFVGR